MTNRPCCAWDCGRPGIAHLTIRRPCGHPVALNSSGLRLHERDGTRPAYVQRQWYCGPCILRRHGRSAPGPSTCPTCGVREPVQFDPMMHAPGVTGQRTLCATEDVATVYTGPHRSLITCPECIEWLHA